MTHIMLDAGHGQRDPGAIGPTGLQEKDAALALVKRLGRLLGEQGLEVGYTRSDDWRLVDESSAEDLRARADKANQARADYFVSVHHNSAKLAQRHSGRGLGSKGTDAAGQRDRTCGPRGQDG